MHLNPFSLGLLALCLPLLSYWLIGLFAGAGAVLLLDPRAE